MNLIIHTDGGARGNPGPAAVGVVIYSYQEKQKLIHEFGKKIGETTNNVAEYRAVIEALKWVRENFKSEESGIPAWADRRNQESSETNQQTDSSQTLSQGGSTINHKENIMIYFKLDSMLVVNQLNGLFKVKDQNLRELLLHVRQLEQEIGEGMRITYTYIPREQNREADLMVNRAMDGGV